jgi:hypothetical protein
MQPCQQPAGWLLAGCCLLATCIPRLRYSYSRAFGKWHEYDTNAMSMDECANGKVAVTLLFLYVGTFLKLILLLVAIHVWASWPARARAPPCTSPCAGHTT